MEISKTTDEQENFALWQWFVILGLLIAITISLYFYFFPFNRYVKPLTNQSFTIDKEIEGYKKQLGNTKNFLVYNRLASAYIRKARMTGDVSWYILAEQNAKMSLIQSPVNNNNALISLASINMARHDFNKAIELSKQTIDDPNYTLDALGVIFDAYNSLGDINNSKKTLSEIEKAKKEILSYKVKNTPIDSIPDPVNHIRYAQIDYLEGKTEDAEKHYLKAIKDSIILNDEPKAWVYSMYSDFLIKHGRFEEANENLRYSLNYLPDYKAALMGKAEISRMQNNWSDVIKDLKAQNDLNPHSDLILRLAEAEKKLANNEEYTKYIKQAESLLSQELRDGNFGHRRDYINLLLEQNTPSSIKQALKFGEEEIKLRKDLDTLITVAKAQIKNHQDTDAKDNLTMLLTKGIKDSRVFYLTGKAEENLGNKNQAKLFYQKAITVNSKFDPDYVQDINNFLKR